MFGKFLPSLSLARYVFKYENFCIVHFASMVFFKHMYKNLNLKKQWQRGFSYVATVVEDVHLSKEVKKEVKYKESLMTYYEWKRTWKNKSWKFKNIFFDLYILISSFHVAPVSKLYIL